METELPGLQWELTRENYQRAVTANSGACVHADAIKEQYPEYTHVKVNMATIQVSDKERGVRYVYLISASAAEVLLAFDQGWPEEKFPQNFRIKQPVKVIPIIRSASDVKTKAERRAVRLAELESKEQSAEPLTRDEKITLSRLRNPKKSPSRPTTYGPGKVEIARDDVVRIGAPGIRAKVKLEKYHANLIDERNRHFGARTAQPSEVFKREVEKAVQERLEEAIEADRAKRS